MNGPFELLPGLLSRVVEAQFTFILQTQRLLTGFIRIWIQIIKPSVICWVTFLLLAGALLQIRLQLSQLHALRCVGWRQQTGRVQCKALVIDQVCLPWEGLLQLQALQLLGQDCLAAAQVTMSSSGLSRLSRGRPVPACFRGRAGNWVRYHLMGGVLEDCDGG